VAEDFVQALESKLFWIFLFHGTDLLIDCIKFSFREQNEPRPKSFFFSLNEEISHPYANSIK